MVNFKFKNSCFDKYFVFIYEGRLYERLGFSKLKDPQFRLILSQDDYDYVTDKKLEKDLLEYWRELSNGK